MLYNIVHLNRYRPFSHTARRINCALPTTNSVLKARKFIYPYFTDRQLEHKPEVLSLQKDVGIQGGVRQN